MCPCPFTGTIQIRNVHEPKPIHTPPHAVRSQGSSASHAVGVCVVRAARSARAHAAHRGLGDTLLQRRPRLTRGGPAWALRLCTQAGALRASLPDADCLCACVRAARLHASVLCAHRMQACSDVCFRVWCACVFVCATLHPPAGGSRQARWCCGTLATVLCRGKRPTVDTACLLSRTRGACAVKGAKLDSAHQPACRHNAACTKPSVRRYMRCSLRGISCDAGRRMG